MLEKEARRKFCPYKMNSPDASQNCDGLKCMGWEELTDPVYENPDAEPSWKRKTIGQKPKEPAEGYCGMVPPAEVYVNQ